MDALGSAYPVSLHGYDPFRPSVKVIKTVRKFLSVVGYPYEPLLKAPLHDRGAAAPADTVPHHLFIGKDSFAVLAPVDRGMLAVNKSFLVELEEKPLVPFIIIDVARLYPSSPVVAVPGPF